MEPAQRKEPKIATLIGLAIVLTLIAGLLLSLSNIAKKQRMYLISSFAECKTAGYPIQESYPETCVTPDGRSFVNDSQSAQIQVSTTTMDAATTTGTTTVN